jgi:hypothetical protein
MAESASMKTTPTASDSELGGPGYIDDDDYKPDQVTINTQRFLNYKWMVFQVTFFNNNCNEVFIIWSMFGLDKVALPSTVLSLQKKVLLKNKWHYMIIAIKMDPALSISQFLRGSVLELCFINLTLLNQTMLGSSRNLAIRRNNRFQLSKEQMS